MATPTTSPTDLDRATRLTSTFPSFSALTADMAATGYFPTIRLDRFIRPQRLRDANRLLRRALHDRGLRMFPAWGEYRDEVANG